MSDDVPVGAILIVLGLLGMVTFGVRQCGFDAGWHESKWRERCRHMQCEHGLADWAQINGTDACVCVTTSRGKK